MASISLPKLVIALALTLMVFTTLISPTRGSILSKVTVNITNLLSPANELRYKCKSKDDDLGPKVLAPNQSWLFRFRPKLLFVETLFFCRMEWNGGPGPVYMDMYDAGRDYCHQCCWGIHATGPCFHVCDEPGDKPRCDEWRKPTPQEALLFS